MINALLTIQGYAQHVAGPPDTVPTFYDINVESAYRTYMAFLYGDADSAKAKQAALHFLGAICDYYLNRQHGDFIRITYSNKFQR